VPDRPSVPEPSVPDLLTAGPPDLEPLAGTGSDTAPTDERPNRAARRRKRAGVPAASTHRGVAPHARGAQGRRVNPIRRTG
jgi:hypothetical protein